jgi:invasion protein IalB
MQMQQIPVRELHSLARFGLSSLACVLLAASAGAQEGKGLNNRLLVEPPRIQLPQNIDYSAWRKVCFKGSDGVTICRTTSSGLDEIGQVIVRVDLIERADGPGRLQLFIPQGFSLQAGVKVTVDQGEAARFPYTYCLSNICIAADPAKPGMVAEMETGKTLKVEQTNFSSSPSVMNLPLNQFAAAHKGPPAATYDFNMDSE